MALPAIVGGMLIRWAIDEAVALSSVESRVEDIRRELMLMKAFLNDIQSRGEVEEEGFNEWVDDLNEVTRNADDVIETFLLISVGKSMSFSWVDRFMVGKEVERISEKMRNLSQRRVKYDPSHQRNTSVQVESLTETSHNAVEKLSSILSENLVADFRVIKIVEEVKDLVVSMLKVVYDLKLKEQPSEREKLWLEEADAVCDFTLSVIEDFITRRGWFLRDMIWRFLTNPSQLLSHEQILMKKMRKIKTRVRGALYRQLTYRVGEVESLAETSRNLTEATALEKLSYILNENLVSFVVEEIVEEVKDEVVSMLKVMSNLKSKGQASEREMAWLEEANTICNFTISVIEDFITRRRRRRREGLMARVLRDLVTFIYGPSLSEVKLMKEMKYIKTQVRGALFRQLTYGIGEEDVGDKIGFGDNIGFGLISMILVLSSLLFSVSLFSLLSGALISISVIFVLHTVYKSKYVDKKLESIRRDLALMHAFFKDITDAEGLNERQKVWMEQIRDTAQQAEVLLAAYELRVNQYKGVFRRLFQLTVPPLEFDGEINYTLYKIHKNWERKSTYDIANIEGREDLVLGQSMQGSGSEIQIVVEHTDNSGTEEDPLLPVGMSNNHPRFKGYTNKTVELLREEMQLMKALFDDANKMGELDRRSKIWVEQMKDIAREIESFSNDYASKLEDKSIHKSIFYKYYISFDIVGVRKRIKETWRIREGYDIHLQTRAESSSEALKSPLGLKEFNTITTNLPLYLTRCLSYFVLFPPEFEIPTRRLIVLWVAEGLVRHGQDQAPPEQAAERYLTELIELKMVEVTSNRRNGKVKTCRLFNALRESSFFQARLSINSGSVSNESITHQGAVQSSTNSDSVQKKPIIRQVADLLRENDICYNHIHSDTITASASLKSLYKDVLSFLSFDTREGGKPGQDIGKFLNRCISSGCFLQLRVLDLEKVYKPQLSENIARLSRLRYLGLRWTYLESLPSSISSLLKLQTLDLKHTYISILPSSIWKMQLRHLFLSETYRTRFPSGFTWKMELRQLFLGETYSSIFPPYPKGNSLSDLQTLWGLFVDEKTPVKGGLNRLVNIRKLGLACQSMSLGEEEMTQQLHAVAEWIMNLKYLQSLRLKSRKEDGQPGDLHLVSLEKQAVLADMYLSGILKSPPMKSLFPPSLIELTLSHSNLQQDSIEILGELPLLQSLCLLAGSYIEETLHCKRGSFPRLLALKVWKLKELREWNIEEAAFPLLEHLEIRSCECLQMLPDGLEHISTLRELKLTTMSEKFIERVDKHKIPFSCMVFRYCIIPVSSNLLAIACSE